MRTIYLRKETNDGFRKVLLDMAFLASHKIIRFPQYLFEEGLYFSFKSKGSDNIEKYYLTKDKIVKQDQNFYFFKFPFKGDEVEEYSN